jgi:hypothetical protein
MFSQQNTTLHNKYLTTAEHVGVDNLAPRAKRGTINDEEREGSSNSVKEF